MRAPTCGLVLAAVAVLPAAAQVPVVVAQAPARLSVTVYRDPDRDRRALDLRYLGGFALVTEQRRVRLPKGPAVIRFEGVAEGIVPVSAIVEGLPGGTVEKNRDARLLSPAALVDGTLGRRVTLTRTDRATGRQVLEDATIVAGPSPGVVVRTRSGVEALRCSGLPERLGFPGVPAGLSPEPVLSVATHSPAARTVTVSLSYLASGFDWQASYVATLDQAANRLRLFAWATLANGNRQRFAEAEVQAVAGRLNRSGFERIATAAAGLRLSCFPLGTTTSDLREDAFEPADEIVVTGSRMMPPPAMVAAPAPAPAPPPPPEDVGDLKLYRVPGRVSIAARAQKQVALLLRDAVPFERRYRRPVQPGQALAAAPTRIVLQLKNTEAGGLGLALPTGTTAVYAQRAGEALLLGTGSIADRAAGESFRLSAGISRQVRIDQQREADDRHRLTATNANPFPVAIDVPIGGAGARIDGEGVDLPVIDGVRTWSTVLPPNGTAELRYRVKAN